MKSAGKARSNGLYRHIRTSKEIIRNLLNYYIKLLTVPLIYKNVIDLIQHSPVRNFSNITMLTTYQHKLEYRNANYSHQWLFHIGSKHNRENDGCRSVWVEFYSYRNSPQAS